MHLAQRLLPLRLIIHNYPVLSQHLPCLGLARDFRAALRSVEHLTLSISPSITAEWAVVTATMPALTQLTISESAVTEAALAALVSGSRISELSVVSCYGFPWRALAAIRAHPLKVTVTPRLGLPIIEKCREIQELVFGRMHLSF